MNDDVKIGESKSFDLLWFIVVSLRSRVIVRINLLYRVVIYVHMF